MVTPSRESHDSSVTYVRLSGLICCLGTYVWTHFYNSDGVNKRMGQANGIQLEFLTIYFKLLDPDCQHVCDTSPAVST